MRRIIVLLCILLFASISQAQTYLPFDLYFGMSKKNVMNKLDDYRHFIIKNEDDELIYSRTNKEPYSIDRLSLYFDSNKKLVQLTFHITNMSQANYTNYSQNYMKTFLKYPSIGYTLIKEDKLNNMIILGNKDIYIIARHGLDEWSKKGYSETSIYEKNYAKKTNSFFAGLKE